MRQYLLDSAVLSAYLRGRPAALALAQAWVYAGETTTSMACVGEVAEYLKSFPNYLRHWQAFRTLLIRVHPYPLTYAIAQRYADVRRALRPPHGPGLIGDIDTLIAATALEYGVTLVTTDSDFYPGPRSDGACVATRRTQRNEPDTVARRGTGIQIRAKATLTQTDTFGVRCDTRLVSRLDMLSHVQVCTLRVVRLSYYSRMLCYAYLKPLDVVIQ